LLFVSGVLWVAIRRRSRPPSERVSH
jgi:hypothetical protein